MARIRTIKPAFFESPTIARLPHRARLTFVGLWTYVDDAGRGYDDPRLVKAAVWPLDDDVDRHAVAEDLNTIEQERLIERWTDSATGRALLRVRSFNEHQRINRPTPSKLPPSPYESDTAHQQLSESDVSPPVALTHGSSPEAEAEAEAEAEREGGSGTGGGVTGADPAAVERELRKRVAARRLNGEDIGPGLERLIRADVIRDLDAVAPRPVDPFCNVCRGNNGNIERADGTYVRCNHEAAA